MVGLARTIKSMFTTGVNGAWYDPSDFSTLFQDAAGTTPVTAVGQPVGLMLDKSKGLMLGPNLATNSTFDTDISGWTVLSGNTSIWSGQRAFVGGGGSITGIYQDFPTVSGKFYRVSADVEYVSGSGARLRIVDGGGFLNSQDSNIISSGSGVATTYIRATGTTMRIILRASDSTSGGPYAYFDNISIKEISGNHAFNSSGNSANFPVLQQDGTGRYYLAFNGVNQWLQTNSIDLTYGDKILVCAGVRKLSDAAAGTLAELSSVWASNTGAFGFFAPVSAAANFGFASRGSSNGASTISPSLFPSPVTSVISGVGDIYSPSTTIRVNGSQVAQSIASQGAGNYGNHPLYIGARAGTSLFFNGRLYGLVVAGKQASAREIASTEAWLNQKTGAY